MTKTAIDQLADDLGIPETPMTIEQSMTRIALAFERIASALESGSVSPAPATPPIKPDSLR